MSHHFLHTAVFVVINNSVQLVSIMTFLREKERERKKDVRSEVTYVDFDFDTKLGRPLSSGRPETTTFALLYTKPKFCWWRLTENERVWPPPKIKIRIKTRFRKKNNHEYDIV